MESEFGTSATSADVSAPRLDTLHLNVTNTCNLACAFCYSDARRSASDELPIATITETATDFRALGGDTIILSGGEPFVRRDWEDVFYVFAVRGCRLSIVTNGTRLTSAIVRKLRQFSRKSVLISIDGTEATHDALRGVSGAFSKTQRALKLLKADGVDLQINCTISKRNIRDLPYLSRLSRDLDVSLRLSLLNVSTGRGPAMAGLALSLPEIEALRDYCHKLRGAGSKIYFNLPPLLLQPEDQIPAGSAGCGWAQGYCGILANGDVTICGVANALPSLVAGNVNRRRLIDIWRHSPLFQRLRQLRTSDLQGVCGDCVYRDSCGGACRLAAYIAHSEMLAPLPLCQAFVELALHSAA